jgi:3',5'-nucleoside bisphosphate phosphatase
MIDLHTHTNESDGTFTPAALVAEAARIGLEALAISDHDTFAGYEQALPHARAADLDLVCGIELSTKLRGRSVHLLGYFFGDPPALDFREWLERMQASRRDRNRRMVERLRALDVEITLQEVEAKGRSITGRPHFAKVLLEKGYVKSMQQAFDDYLDESAKGYVYRVEASLEEGIQRIAAAGGLPSIAHPVRLPAALGSTAELIAEMRAMGLQGIEVYHSDHSPAHATEYLALAKKLNLAVTGGSDFHGAAKPHIRLGSGHNGNLNIPLRVLDELRALV